MASAPEPGEASSTDLVSGTSQVPSKRLRELAGRLWDRRAWGWSSGASIDPAHLRASYTVVVELEGYVGVVWCVAYRAVELFANVCLVACVSWRLQLWVLAVLLLLLWYAPAVVHTESWVAPIRTPMLCFVVDDFSLLNLHPARRDPGWMYRIMIARIVVCYILLLVAEIYVYPLEGEASLGWLVRFDGQDFLVDDPGSVDTWDSHDVFFDEGKVWFILRALIGILSLLWLVWTARKLSKGNYDLEKNPQVLQSKGCGHEEAKRQIYELKKAIHDNCELEDQECYKMMRKLKQAHPSMALASPGNTLGPALGFWLRFLSEMFAIYLFAGSGDYLWAALLVCTLLLTAYRHGRTPPWVIFTESLRSIRRGVRTERFFRLIWADMGAHVLPATLIKVSSLPMTTSGGAGAFSALVAASGVFAVVVVTSIFVFEQFDLGTEEEGHDHDPRRHPAASDGSSAHSGDTRAGRTSSGGGPGTAPLRPAAQGGGLAAVPCAPLAEAAAAGGPVAGGAARLCGWPWCLPRALGLGGWAPPERAAGRASRRGGGAR